MFCVVNEHGARFQADARSLSDAAAFSGEVIKRQFLNRRLALLTLTIIFVNDSNGHIYDLMVLHCNYRAV